MSRVREDPSLPSFTPPASVPRLGREEPDLAIAAPGAARAFRLDGERVSLHGTANGPVSDVWIDGTRVVTALDGSDGAVANTITSPGRMRRERIGRAGSAEEVFLVPQTLPLAAFQWTGPEAAPLRLRACPDASGIRYRTDGSTVTLATDDSDLLLVLVLASGSERWTVEEQDGWDGVVLTDTGASMPRTLLVTLGSPDGIRSAMRGARHLAAHEARATRRSDAGSLRLRTGARELDDAVDWMSSRLRCDVDRADAGSEPTPPERRAWLWAGLGAISIGDEESATRCAAILEPTAADTEAGLLTGLIGLATGKTERASVCLQRLHDPDFQPSASDAPGTEMLRRLTSHTLADALRYGAPEASLSRLREPGPKEGIGLPTVSAAPPTPPSLESWIRTLARESHGTGDAREDTLRALGAWAEMFADIDAGWASWRSLVAEGLTNGRHGIAAWDPLDPVGPPGVTGLLLAGMAHGWLGIRPDAPVGRLRLTPRMPAHITRFHVSGIPVGDARIALGYERIGEVHRFDLEVERGRVPPLVAFEPTLQNGVERVRVDEAVADPEIIRSGRSTTVRLQTPLDAKRRIEVDGR